MSGYWYKKDAAQGNDPSIHALIIACGKYLHTEDGDDPAGHESFGLKQLKSSVRGAMRFAEWVRDTMNDGMCTGKTIRVLASPSPHEASLVNRNYSAATYSNARAAIRAWKDDCHENEKNIGVVYLAGHGIRLSKLDGYLLLEDFAADQLAMENTIDIGNVYRGMVDCKAKRQVYFVDACRAIPDDATDYDELGARAILVEHAGVVDDRQAYLYFATTPQRVAYGRKNEGSVFSNVLMNVLKLQGAVEDDLGNWMIKADQLLEPVTRGMKELLDPHDRHQVPTLESATGVVVLHRFSQPPKAPFHINTVPTGLNPPAFADIADRDFQQIWTNRQIPCSGDLPVGPYSCEVSWPQTPGSPKIKRQLIPHRPTGTDYQVAIQ